MAVAYPVIGKWYRRTNGTLFEVVAVDEQDATVEIQFFDGTIDDIELENWPSMLIERAVAPEDWSGSVDMDPEDFRGLSSGDIPPGYSDPLSFIEKTD